MFKRPSSNNAYENNAGEQIEKIAEKEAHLRSIIASYQRVIIAFSGGVDSSLVAKIANEELGYKNAIAVIAKSPSLSQDNFKQALSLARHIKPRLCLKVVHTDEMKIDAYRKNDRLRCYFCKQTLYAHLKKIQKKYHAQAILNGENQSDLSNTYRLGAQAARDAHIKSPLQIAKLNKSDVRSLAKKIGLANHDKNADACIASRIAYHQAISTTNLKQVEVVERALHHLGFQSIRCRHHREVARLEVPLKQFQLALQHKDSITAICQQAGFLYAALDLSGFKSGSLNLMLKK